MNKEELIGKLQMVYVGDINALNELIGYYDGLKQVTEELQQENNQLKEELKYTVPIVEHNKIVSKKLKENKKYKEVIDKAIEYLEEPNRDSFDYSKAKLLEILKGVE